MLKNPIIVTFAITACVLFVRVFTRKKENRPATHVTPSLPLVQRREEDHVDSQYDGPHNSQRESHHESQNDGQSEYDSQYDDSEYDSQYDSQYDDSQCDSDNSEYDPVFPSVVLMDDIDYPYCVRLGSKNMQLLQTAQTSFVVSTYLHDPSRPTTTTTFRSLNDAIDYWETQFTFMTGNTWDNFVLGDMRRMFGTFECSRCSRWWYSAYAWPGKKQQCEGCRTWVLAVELSDLRSGERSSSQKKHLKDSCEMCREKGQFCGWI